MRTGLATAAAIVLLAFALLLAYGNRLQHTRLLRRMRAWRPPPPPPTSEQHSQDRPDAVQPEEET